MAGKKDGEGETRNYVLVLRVRTAETSQYNCDGTRSFQVKVDVQAMRGIGSDDYARTYEVLEREQDLLRVKQDAALYLWKANDPDKIKSETVSVHEIKWNPEYCDEIGLAECQRAGKLLASIEKKLEAMRAREGSARGFGQYVNRLARALGIEHVIVQSRRHEGWVWWNIGETPGVVDSLFETWRQKVLESLGREAVA